MVNAYIYQKSSNGALSSGSFDPSRGPTGKAASDPHEDGHEERADHEHGPPAQLVRQVKGSNATRETAAHDRDGDSLRLVDADLVEEDDQVRRDERVALRLLQALHTHGYAGSVQIRALEAVGVTRRAVVLCLVLHGLLDETELTGDFIRAGAALAGVQEGLEGFFASAFLEKPSR